jgi:hypothetical protein
MVLAGRPPGLAAKGIAADRILHIHPQRVFG